MSETIPAFAPTLPERDAGPLGFGATLAQARKRAGLSLDAVAGRLRLHAKQLDALEHEDLDVLPAAVYVSGFLRNYARELKLDAVPLLQDLDAKLAARGLGRSAVDFAGAGASGLPVLDERRWRQLVMTVIIAVLVCAGLIGTWIAHRPAAGGGVAAPRASTPARVAEPAAESKAPQAAPGAPVQTPDEAGARAGVASAPAEPSAAPQLARMALPASAVQPAPTLAPALPAAPAAAPPATPGPAPAPAPAIKLAGTHASMAGLLLRFNERSWFEVSQTDGRVLLSRTGEAGSMEMLNTPAPLQLVVGRAEAVRVEYRGQPVDLKPYINSNGVARLTLADGRVSGGGSNSR